MDFQFYMTPDPFSPSTDYIFGITAQIPSYSSSLCTEITYSYENLMKLHSFLDEILLALMFYRH